ncbi:MAG: peptide chain release factor N(5)-glutamine methyltransferase [Gammaproteobacteria bacterium]|nr:peptide chain release factor N(5)-glutamine methyltransferase [Gammaproteobacteria bacterium]
MNAAGPQTIGDCVGFARRRLPRLEADVLTAYALVVPRSDLYAFQERSVNPRVGARVAEWVERRVGGEPVAYILGEREFWGLRLSVTPDALIPRSETETLVAAALPRTGPKARVADLGTGCGAIALAVASERPEARIIATDIDLACVELCRRNALRLQLAATQAGLGVDVVAADLFDGIGGEFDVIVSNPPYVAAGDAHLNRGDLRFEPRLALDGGACGLRVIERLIREAPGHLADGGWLCIEHGCTQHQAVRGLFVAAGFDAVECIPDLEQRPRATVGQKRVAAP